jgi:small GTP-binding protein
MMSTSSSSEFESASENDEFDGQLHSFREWWTTFAERSAPDPTDGSRAAKVVMNGPATGGKTSFLACAVTGVFQTGYVPTMVDSFKWTVRNEKKQTDVNLEIWDTFGRSDYDRLRPLIYPNTDLMVLCFDVASRDMFESMFDKYLPEVQHHIPATPVVLLGLKADLRDNARVIAMLAARKLVMPTRREIESRARKFNLPYFEVSAKTDLDSVNATLAAFGAIIDDNARKTNKKTAAKTNQGWFRRWFSKGD